MAEAKIYSGRRLVDICLFIVTVAICTSYIINSLYTKKCETALLKCFHGVVESGLLYLQLRCVKCSGAQAPPFELFLIE